jgi:AmmeMemoRadiSam system protein B/AmmeMemoRadiSam system protein A
MTRVFISCLLLPKVSVLNFKNIGFCPMKVMSNPILLLMLAFAFLVLLPAHAVLAETVRKPVWAGIFYEANPSELGQNIDQLTRKTQKTRIQIPKNKRLRAIIMPHAGYIYSGWTAAHVARVLSADQFSKVILLGPDHRIGFKSAAICDVTAYETPLGKINLHKDSAKLRLQPDLFQSLPVSRDKEHSIEVILPFLQRYLDDFQLVPIIIGQSDVPQISNALDSIIDSDTLLVVSTDLSHFLSYTEAVARDRETIDEIINLKPDKLIKTDNRACGKIPLLILTEIARRHHWHPLLLHYSNSGDTAGDRSRVVGYAAFAFYEDLSMENKGNAGAQFSEVQGQELVKLARKTILDKLGGDASGPVSEDLLSALKDDRFKLHRGTFVTLKIKGQLRGCIGNLTSMETVLESVNRNAVNAAFHDPRFSPLSKEELGRTVIEVSILTEPQPLVFRDGQDLIKNLRVHVDGVIIRKGHAGATFLPQVWEQLPKPEDFLAHLCMKAGLPSDAWENSELEVLTYQVQYFEENQ